jgi:hypothetical protein
MDYLSPILLEILKYFVTFRRKWLFILTDLSITYSIRNVTIFLIVGEGENYRAIFHLSFLLWCPSTIPSDNTDVSYFRHHCQKKFLYSIIKITNITNFIIIYENFLSENTNIIFYVFVGVFVAIREFSSNVLSLKLNQQSCRFWMPMSN